jgi:hypothetical protein
MPHNTLLATKKVTSAICHAPVRSEPTHLRVANIVFPVVTGCCIILRFVYQGLFNAAGLGWDDCVVGVTVFISVPSVIIIQRGLLANEIGVDLWAVPFDQLEKFLRSLYTVTLLYFILAAMVKIALILFFLRIFMRRRTVRLLWGTVAFIGVWALAFVIPASLPCLPVSEVHS